MSLSATIDLPAEEATHLFAGALSRVLRSGDVVLLQGELGSGKTTLTRGVASALGISPQGVSSPTFVLMHQHEVPEVSGGVGVKAGGADEPTSVERVRVLVHIDAYRLREASDLESLGWDRVFDSGMGRARPGHCILIEWGERLVSRIDAASAARLTLEHDPPGRALTLEVPDSWGSRPGVDAMLHRPPTRCRVTGAWVGPDAAAYPFASEKARLADLNRWFTGSYEISRPIKDADFDETGPAAS